jgi:hypothetical protein
MECIARSTTIWAGRTICQIGRLEPRKGVFECVDALVSIAADYPDLRVDFIGADTPLRVTGGPSVANSLRRRMPARVRHQLRFHGSLDPSGVRALLGQASAAVVPSRWENFPYSCIEAMASGLPAVVSPHGGMRELVDDGISGWIAESGSPAGIAAALRRALDASGEQRERMGLAAAASVDRRCANDRVVRLHREWKRSIAQQASATATIDARPAHTRGIAVVVTGSAEPTERAGIRNDLQAQSEAPALIMIAADDPVCGSSARAAPRRVGSDLPTSAIDTLLATPALLGVVWIDARLQLNPGALAACRRAFERDRFAVLSSWVAETGPPARVRVASNPARPAVRDDGLPAPLLAVSMSALRSAQRDLLADGGSVVDRICRSGAPTLIYPAVLGSLASAAGLGPLRQRARFSSMAKVIQRLHTPLWRWLYECSPEDRRDFVVDALRNPRQAIRWLARRLAAGSRLQAPGSTNPARNP